jgi:FkbM family methyltransferase
MFKKLVGEVLGHFDRVIVRKSDQDSLNRGNNYLRSVLSFTPWAPYWALLPEEEREFIAPYIGYSKSQLGQDLFALNESRKCTYQKFFVEFGASDGKSLSNTWLLEKKLGWVGIVAEPAQCWHETLKANRSCSIDTRCISTRTGDRIPFLEVSTSDKTGPELSSLASYADNGDLFSKDRLKNSREYLVETVSLLDLLQIHGAPQIIDYMSIDTEGSELDILSSFDFEKYRVRIISVEHNFRPEIRAALFSLLSSKGFVRKHAVISRFDDWYVAQA